MSRRPVCPLVCLIIAAGVINACQAITPAPTAVPVEASVTPISQSTADATSAKGDQSMAFQLTSKAFGAGQAIPAPHTCRGKDVSPPLSWTEPPKGTQSFALTCSDPDAPAGDWVHWIVYNLPAGTRTLPEGLSTDGQLADGSRQGINGWRQTGYRGPCPPSGTHRYVFKLYALDVQLSLPAGADKERLLKAMKGHILGEAELIGMFSK